MIPIPRSSGGEEKLDRRCIAVNAISENQSLRPRSLIVLGHPTQFARSALVTSAERADRIRVSAIGA